MSGGGWRVEGERVHTAAAGTRAFASTAADRVSDITSSSRAASSVAVPSVAVPSVAGCDPPCATEVGAARCSCCASPGPVVRAAVLM